MSEVSVARRLEALDTCVLSDAMDSFGLSGVLAGIVPMWRGGRVAGPARTMLLRRIEDGEVVPPAAAHLGTRAIDDSAPGDVIVVAHQGRADSAGWGGLLSMAASVREVRAVVVDGACRDVDESEQLGLPVFARSGTPVSARSRTVEVAVGEPVECAGVRVAPRDWIVADANGVLAISADVVLDVLAKAEELSAREQRMRAAILAGSPSGSVLDRRYEEMTTRSEGGVDALG